MTTWERAALPLNGVMAALFGSLSALRRKRIFHPDGVAYRGTLTFLPSEMLDPRVSFAGGVTSDAIIRFSRGAGVPQSLPDVLGIAVKLPDFGGPGRDTDLLMVTSGEGPMMQNVLLPARGYFRHDYSTVLPYRAPNGTEHVLLGARPDTGLTGRADETFQDIADAVAAARLRFDLTTARIGGKWKKAGSLVVETKLDQDTAESVRFNPWNAHPQLVPAGPFNTWRKSAYEKSQAARPST